jgi:hypothetical protein
VKCASPPGILVHGSTSFLIALSAARAFILVTSGQVFAITVAFISESGGATGSSGCAGAGGGGLLQAQSVARPTAARRREERMDLLYHRTRPRRAARGCDAGRERARLWYIAALRVTRCDPARRLVVSCPPAGHESAT